MVFWGPTFTKRAEDAVEGDTVDNGNPAWPYMGVPESGESGGPV